MAATDVVLTAFIDLLPCERDEWVWNMWTVVT